MDSNKFMIHGINLSFNAYTVLQKGEIIKCLLKRWIEWKQRTFVVKSIDKLKSEYVGGWKREEEKHKWPQTSIDQYECKRF